MWMDVYFELHFCMYECVLLAAHMNVRWTESGTYPRKVCRVRCMSMCVCICGWVGVFVCVCIYLHIYIYIYVPIYLDRGNGDTCMCTSESNIYLLCVHICINKSDCGGKV